MADHPLRLKIFTLLFILDCLLTYLMTFEIIKRQSEALPYPFSTWVWITVATLYAALFLLLAAVWVRNRLGYALALLYIGFEVAWYFIVYPTYPTIFLIIEASLLILLLSLFNYFFAKP